MNSLSPMKILPDVSIFHISLKILARIKLAIKLTETHTAETIRFKKQPFDVGEVSMLFLNIER